MNKKPIYLKAKDHSVSGEEFELIQNSEYGFLETSPQPSSDKLPDYYKSGKLYFSYRFAKKPV